MADHPFDFSLLYDGTYHPAPVLNRDRVTLRRGANGPSADLDPAEGRLTLHDPDGLYAPLSAVSPLRGKIGQNTRAQVSIDGTVLLTGEVSEWRPESPVRGSGWSKTVTSGVLRRLGRGTDPIDSAVVRASLAVGPTSFWPLEFDLSPVTAGAAPLLDVIDEADAFHGEIDWDGEAVIPGLQGVVRTATADGTLHTRAAPMSGQTLLTSAAAWSVGVWVIGTPWDTGDIAGQLMQWGPSIAGEESGWRLNCRSGPSWAGAAASFSQGSSGTGAASSSTATPLDGRPHFYCGVAEQVAGNVRLTFYYDGVATVGTPFAGTLVVPTSFDVGWSNGAAAGDTPNVWVGAPMWVGRALTALEVADIAAAGLAYVGETAADRFTRFCGEEGLDTVVIGDPDDSAVMGPQLPVPRLEVLSTIATTDDALIFETRDALGLTMRTGPSRQNQDPLAVISYIGDVVPPLRPVVGDAGIRNDVTAANAAGAKQRVVQLIGPHNVELPEDDPQGVGPYRSQLDVEPATVAGLADCAGWRVHLGTYDGVRYDAVTVDLDAAPALIGPVDGLDIGDAFVLVSLPASDSLEAVELQIIGREDSLTEAGKRRTVTFFCVPNAPYRVGVLSIPSGETGTYSGHLEADGSEVASAAAAGAATFSVATPSGPIWTTAADNFPMDFVVDGQRVSVSSISGMSSPQTFTVQSAALGGRQIAYPLAAGSPVTVYQPIILVQ